MATENTVRLYPALHNSVTFPCMTTIMVCRPIGTCIGNSGSTVSIRTAHIWHLAGSEHTCEASPSAI